MINNSFNHFICIASYLMLSANIVFYLLAARGKYCIATFQKWLGKY